MERVDVAEVLEVGGDPVGEGVDDVGELLLGQVDRPGVDVDDPEPRLDVDDVGRVEVGAAGEHVGLHARLGEGRHELPHVDVHAAAVALAGLGER